MELKGNFLRGREKRNIMHRRETWVKRCEDAQGEHAAREAENIFTTGRNPVQG